MGEFDSRNDVISYLKSIGVNESYINSNTVGDGKGDGGTHWRIESNGSEGCVINNRTDGKKSTAMNAVTDYPELAVTVVMKSGIAEIPTVTD